MLRNILPVQRGGSELHCIVELLNRPWLQNWHTRPVLLSVSPTAVHGGVRGATTVWTRTAIAPLHTKMPHCAVYSTVLNRQCTCRIYLVAVKYYSNSVSIEGWVDMPESIMILPENTQEQKMSCLAHCPVL